MLGFTQKRGHFVYLVRLVELDVDVVQQRRDQAVEVLNDGETSPQHSCGQVG